SCSMRSPRCSEFDGDGAIFCFITREDRPNPTLCQPLPGRRHNLPEPEGSTSSILFPYPSRESYERPARASCGLFLGGGGLDLQAWCENRLKEGHHRAQLGAELLNGMLLLALARGQKVAAALSFSSIQFFAEAPSPIFRRILF